MWTIWEIMLLVIVLIGVLVGEIYIYCRYVYPWEEKKRENRIPIGQRITDAMEYFEYIITHNCEDYE